MDKDNLKIINLGLDSSAIDKESKLTRRIIEYGELVDKYDVIVSAEEDKEVVLSNKAKVFGVRASNKLVGLYKIYRNALKLLNQEKYNIITVQDQYYLALAGWLLAKKNKAGLELQIHGFEKYKGARKMIAKFIIPRAHAIRTVSKRLKKQLVNEFQVKEEIITVVPIYVEVANMRKYKANKYELDDKFIFLTIGRLVPVKNIGMQIRAMAEVIKKHNDTELWIIGNGPEKENLQSGIRKLGLENYFKLWGWQDDLSKYYKQADAFLLTSDYEGWGLVVIDAAQFGLPIIMTDVGCAGEVIKGIRGRATNTAHANENNEQSGIVIPVGDQEKLAESMIKIIEDEDLRKRLGENAQAAILNLPTREQTLELYKKSWQIARQQKVL